MLTDRTQTERYERDREYARNASREKVAASQEIGPLPPVKNPERREACRTSFRLFCETYFPDMFYLPWSKDHLKAIDKIEQATNVGGQFALAMPRGTGKTTLGLLDTTKTAVYGEKKFLVLLAASAERAKALLANFKMILETNTLLAEDFPEVCYPLARLERVATRARGQKLDGNPTMVSWTANRIILPTVQNAMSSGVIVTTSGLEGSEIRGLSHVRPDGVIARPDMVIVDDPQTNESAWSESQSRRREAILSADVLGMAGPGKKISALLFVTVNRKGDMADNILDTKKHPEWHGERMKMIYSFPSNEKLWEEYRILRSDSLRNGGVGEEATEYYAENRGAMDTGAEVAWPERYNDDELSAVQHAMNLKFRDETAFFSEYQNEPVSELDSTVGIMTADQIADKAVGVRRIVPPQSSCLTAFIDVHKEVLYWSIVAWEPDFTGTVIDYGTFPEQPRRYFSLANATKTISDAFHGKGTEGALYAALTELADTVIASKYRTESGVEFPITKCLIDANWGESTDVVYQFCREATLASVFTPSHGKYIGAASTPFSEYKRTRGDDIGTHWRVPASTGRRAVRYVLTDVNWWKSFLHERLQTTIGDRGCLSLYAKYENGDKARHALIAEHVTSEYPVKVTAKERTVTEWKQYPSRPDNHWLDCLVGCSVAASMSGVRLPSHSQDVQPERPKVSFSQLQKAARQQR